MVVRASQKKARQRDACAVYRQYGAQPSTTRPHLAMPWPWGNDHCVKSIEAELAGLKTEFKTMEKYYTTAIAALHKEAEGHEDAIRSLKTKEQTARYELEDERSAHKSNEARYQRQKSRMSMKCDAVFALNDVLFDHLKVVTALQDRIDAALQRDPGDHRDTAVLITELQEFKIKFAKTNRPIPAPHQKKVSAN